MAISFALGNWATGDPVNTLEVTPPTHSDGDLLVVFFFADDNQSLTTPETGWTKDIEQQSSVASDSSIAAFYKIASSEPATLTFNRAGTTGFCAAICLKFTGFDSASPLDATSQSTGDQNNSDTKDPPAITVATANANVFVFQGATGCDTNTITQPSGYTSQAQTDNGAAAGSRAIAFLCNKPNVAAGSEDPGTSSGWGTGADGGSITMAIRPSLAVAAIVHHRRMLGMQ